MNRLLVAFGTVLVVTGLLWPWLRRLHLFHLPGDIVIDRPGFKFFFPITTMLIVSAILSIIVWLVGREEVLRGCKPFPPLVQNPTMLLATRTIPATMCVSHLYQARVLKRISPV